jgi:hypothetical protein
MKSLTEPVKLGEKPLQTVNQTVHVGIIRANKNETNLNIQEHISIARKTLYSLIPVWKHLSFSVKLLQFRYLRYI